MAESPFSFVQILGYIAFVTAVIAFGQRSDRRMKLILSVQGTVYALHFHLLLNDAAAAGNVVSVARNLLSLKTRSKYVAGGLIAATLVLAFFTVKSPVGLIPTIPTLIATVAMFNFDGIRLRLCLLVCSCFWLANGIISHSIGGTMLEATVCVTNIVTITRMYRGKQAPVEPVLAEEAAPPVALVE
jgi:hypothetical protein